ncbi:hypothetical protein [Bacillus mycoides]|uniref:hypothetical protein n=1 Tax=Bacillus mycoides TaxID=1405 RepID=UPI002E1DF21D|nr:hypothetical protein [Bacillus mycoides]
MKQYSIHGFGISKEQQMIEELSFVLNKRKYIHEANGTKITITHNGEAIEVTAVDEVYMIKSGRDFDVIHKKTTKRKTLQGAVNMIIAIFDKSKKISGGNNYDNEIQYNM